MIEGEIHELEPGMCFSIEPEIYLSRPLRRPHEDIVAVTDHGGRRLNATSHELRIVA